jgi:1,4-alpha-glucan branching enzyme
MTIDLLERRRRAFVLWRPAHDEPAPRLLIGLAPRRKGETVAGLREIPLARDARHPELWQVPAAECGLLDGRVYFYWFKVRGSAPEDARPRILYCADPLATTVDRRFPAPRPAEEDGDTSGDAACVVQYSAGELVPCDPGGEVADTSEDAPVRDLPPNERLVIYELPTRWVRPGVGDEVTVGRGTFRDVLALLEPDALARGLEEVEACGRGRALLRELGANALELLPPADSDDDLNWGYGTAHYLAADFDLGGGDAEQAPTASRDLTRLVRTCHRYGLRFFADMVMAFSRNTPFHDVNFPDFYVRWRPPGDPDRDPEQGDREGFGGDLFKYNYRVLGYSPWSGARESLVPAREFMKVQMAHWLLYYGVDGLRLDSVNNTGSYDFLQEFKDAARGLWREHPRGRGTDPGRLEERFLVVGEELSVPIALVAQQRLDGLWNERFKQILRRVILGQTFEGLSFEGSVRRMIDPRELGFADGAQVVNYLTSHDVGGAGNERIYDYLVHNGVADAERRVKLAFVCLLTAVGIPMILAGDEFADQHDIDVRADVGSFKQVDPVNYDRLSQDWRRRVFDYVARLVHFRTRSSALARNETDLFHLDESDGKRVVAWCRGTSPDLVVVVANFSDFATPAGPGAEYVVPRFPSASPGRRWREITQDRDVPLEWAGREPIYSWEAKVYALV